MRTLKPEEVLEIPAEGNTQRDYDGHIGLRTAHSFSKNAQLWRFVVITDRAIKEKLTQICKHGKFINEAYAIIAIFYDKDVNYKVEDASAATQNMMLAAWEYGIGSCWIGSTREITQSRLKNSKMPR